MRRSSPNPRRRRLPSSFSPISRRRNPNPLCRRLSSSFFGRGAKLCDYEHLTDEQLDLELARSDHISPSPPPAFPAGNGTDLGSESASHPPPPFSAGDGTDVAMSASPALPPLPAGDDPDPSDDDPDPPHSWWTDDGGRSLFYPVAKKLIPAVTSESQSSDLEVVAAGSSPAASCVASVPADMKGTASQLHRSELLTLCAEILKRPLPNSAAWRAEKTERLNRILGREKD